MKRKRILFILLTLVVLISSVSIFGIIKAKQSIKENTIKVSIIIPVYNVENYIRSCMDSVVNQTLKDIEIICIDDGSPDNSGKIVDEYAQADSRVHVIHQKNSGASAARNRGIDESKGEYIKFVDSDDVLGLTACEICYNKAKSEDADIVLHDFTDTIFNGPQFSVLPPSGVVWSGLYRTNFIKENNIRFNNATSYGEDQAFNLLCGPKANKIVCLSNNLYMYRSDNESSLVHMTKKRVAQFSQNHATNVNYVYNDWKNNGYFSNDTAKVSFLNWFALMNHWKDDANIDKLFLNSIGKELLSDDVLNLLSKDDKTTIKKIINTANNN